MPLLIHDIPVHLVRLLVVIILVVARRSARVEARSWVGLLVWLTRDVRDLVDCSA
jgi:hypothetical protein